MSKQSGARLLPRNDLTARCDARVFGRRVPPFTALINQERAVESLTFGLTMKADGYHILAVDPLGHGRRSALRQTVEAIVAKHWLPAELYDYCYVERPHDTSHPRLLILPAGTARNLRERAAKAFRDACGETQIYFRGTLWQRDRSQVMEAAQKQINAHMRTLQETWLQNGLPFMVIEQMVNEQKQPVLVAKTLIFLDDWIHQAEDDQDSEKREKVKIAATKIIRVWHEANPDPTAESIAFLNTLLAQSQLPIELVEKRGGLLPFVHEVAYLDYWVDEGLNESERSQRQEQANNALQQFFDTLLNSREIMRGVEQTVTEHRDAFIVQAVQKNLESILQDYPAAGEYCMDLIACANGHPLAFWPPEYMQEQDPEEAQVAKERVKHAFTVHVVLAREAGAATPPIVQPDDHSYEALLPTVRPAYHMGGLIVDHTKITSGAMLEANGGVLIIDAHALFDPLRSPTGILAYGKLTDSLKNKKIVPEMPGQRHGGALGEMLEPDPIPLNLKVIVALDPHLYGELNKFQADTLAELFRATAQFAPDTKRTLETERQYAGFVEHQRRVHGLLPFASSAFARIAEHGSRLADLKTHLSLQMSEIKKLAIEADYYARMEHAKSVRRAHVERALQEEHRRISLLTSERMLEHMRNGTIFITVQGSKVGRANGLCVLDAAGLAFGMPSTVTANMWQNNAFDLSFVDRSAGMTGKTFNKAIETITGMVQARYTPYGEEDTIPFAVRVAFEQLYTGIEGDSASVIELCIVLSALGDIPLRQDIACTGSLNQHGEVQPIGGAIEKVEGFFDACQVLGGVEGQGVLVPEANVQNLVLRADVVHACQNKKFHVWGYRRWEDAMELLSGMTVDEVDARIRGRIRTVNEKKKQEKKKQEKTQPTIALE